MRILITGSKGFIGRNLIDAFNENAHVEILPFDKDSDIEELINYTKICDFVFHLAAVHRPVNKSEFEMVNHILFEDILHLLEKFGNSCPVLLTSSIHAGPDTDYGKSKLAAELALSEHANRMKSRGIIYRLTNTFGRYALPNHHSVVANFCYNIINNLPVQIDDPNHIMHLYYIDDVISSFMEHLNKDQIPGDDGIFRLPLNLTYSITLKELSEKIYEFKSYTENEYNLNFSNDFTKKLYDTFLSYTDNIY